MRLSLALDFERAGDDAADGRGSSPTSPASASSRQSSGSSGNRRRCTDASRAGMPLEPGLFHGEDEDRGEPGGEAVEEVVETVRLARRRTEQIGSQ